MRIAVDARELVGRPTGVGRYLAQLLDRWNTSPDARRHEWRLYAHAPVPERHPFTESLSLLPDSGGTSWEQWTLPRALARDRPDVLFAPGYTAPLTARCAVALTIHDVSFAAHPEWFSRREGFRRRTLTAWSARRAKVVLTDSRFSRDEIASRLGIAAGRIRIVPLGVDTYGAPQGAARDPLVLYVGSLFRRRHIDRLVEAFVSVVAPAVPGSRLEIVGENRLHPPADPSAPLRTIASDIARRVAFRSYVDDGMLRDLYARASVFVFLSEYEGFGLTPLEALAAGVPPIVLDTAVAREVYGAAARYVPDPTPRPLGEAIVSLLTDPGEREAILRHAGAILARYSWDRAAELTLRAIGEAAGV